MKQHKFHHRYQLWMEQQVNLINKVFVVLVLFFFFFALVFLVVCMFLFVIWISIIIGCVIMRKNFYLFYLFRY
jgi:hypothetical protein